MRMTKHFVTETKNENGNENGNENQNENQNETLRYENEKRLFRFMKV